MLHKDEDDLRHINVGTEAERRRTRRVLGDVLIPSETGSCEWIPRPRIRAECPTQGVCPYVGCRHHFAIDEVPSGATASGPTKVRLASGFILLERVCALDFVDRFPSGATLEEVGDELLLTRERVRQIEVKALQKLKALKSLHELADQKS